MLKEKKKHMVYLFIGLGLTGLFLLMPDMVYAAGSGVTELDNAANKTNTLVTWVCGWIGGLMALFGIIWAAINQASHNSEGRNQGIIVGAVGIIVAFAPQITNMILGK
jgi:type IV secretory pathway VirB2 component (pilin)